MSTVAHHDGAKPLLQPYYPTLDGLRALAFLAVFTWHYCRALAPASEWFHWGWVGVDQFFVLSGFLITGILFDTLDRENYFSTFYKRRALRIFPLYYFVWLVLLILTPVLHVLWNRYVVAMAFYFGNFFIAGANLGLHPSPSFVPYRSLVHSGETHGFLVDHFWSLCIEEQFYLIWPAVIWFVRSRRGLMVVCAAGILAGLVIRLLVFHFDPKQLGAMGLYYPTYARCDSLFFGSAVALWLRRPSGVTSIRWKHSAVVAFLLSAATLVTIVLLEPQRPGLPVVDPVVCTVGYTLIGIAAAAVLVYALFPDTQLAALLKWRPLVAIGRISYGLYVYHELIMPPLEASIPWLRKHHLAMLYPLLGFAVSWGIAFLSFRYLESPFLRLKRRIPQTPAATREHSLHLR